MDRQPPQCAQGGASAASDVYKGQILKEIGIDGVITAWSDATACILSTFRRGLGRLRHMDLRLAWLQDLVREHVLVMRHIPTEQTGSYTHLLAHETGRHLLVRPLLVKTTYYQHNK